jgi:hypothetical protein
VPRATLAATPARRRRIYAVFLRLDAYLGRIMNSAVIRCRKTSLSLIVVAVLNHGHLHPDYTGAMPSGSGLTRIIKDLRARVRTSGQTEQITRAGVAGNSLHSNPA